MAAKGYVVLYPNPRGSTSYGQEFGNIIQYHYPGDDYKDLMAGVDEMIKRGYIDEKKLGVTGGSGGGTINRLDRNSDNSVLQRPLPNGISRTGPTGGIRQTSGNLNRAGSRVRRLSRKRISKPARL